MIPVAHSQSPKRLTFVMALLLSTFSVSALAWQPSGKVECIAPSDPGGGWDFTCRNVANVMKELDLIPGNMQTTNMAGAGGGVSYAHTISKRRSDDKVIIAASTATTTRLAQKQFPGMKADMVEWLGAVGADYGIIAVLKDSPYKTLPDLLNASKKDPRVIKYAGASARGGWDHLKVLIAAKAGGVKNLPEIPYLSYNNGGEALTQIVGGQVDAFTGDVSEATGFLESGDIRVLAVLAPERLPGKFDHIPTAREQGIDAVAPNWRGFYMPAGASDEAKAFWHEAIDKVYESEQWKQVMKTSGLIPFKNDEGSFDEFIRVQVADIEALSREIGLLK
ncbi:Bug family tripartite tricarboxylate transporter substrate binding protein [Allohahella marinimesophila]|uniref:Tripartite tricarboxylate transporter substrate binding protein n=1 Tax=Allohahella marinimesophila TaxID=1054972 RepID=A0ABP7Q2G1_9GAMM